jgi:P27 family predicted phage terminase small subunit
LLEGARPDRVNQDEPKPVGDLIEPPDWMNESQQAGWRYAIEHAPAGLLKKLDRGVFAVWVVAESLHRDATERVNRYGSVIRAPVTGLPIQSPYLAIVNRQATIMLRSSEQLGFSPAARPRIKLPPQAATSNRFADLKELPPDEE